MLTNGGFSVRIGTFLITHNKGSEEKSTLMDAVQRTPVGVRGYG
jgi:hypothetical protein